MLLETEAAQAETRLQALMMEVLDLAKTDADAKEIVLKYNVKFTPDSHQDTVPDLLPLIEKATSLTPANKKAIPAPRQDTDAPRPQP